MKILLVGHALAPDRGSEPGFTWNWAWHLSEHESVWVIAHPENRTEVEERLELEKRPNLHIEWLNIPKACDPFDPEKGEGWVRLHYTIWQWAALRAARRLHARIGFDVVHHVSLATVNVPPLLWRLGIPSVWGPIGGGQVAPWRFLHYFGASLVRELLRTAHVKLLRLRSDVRRAARRTNIVIATNGETARLLQKAGAHDVPLTVDGGVPRSLIPASIPVRDHGEEVRFLWAGRMERRKGLRIAIEAFASAGPDVPARLLIAGEGPEKAAAVDLVRRLGLTDRVTFLGWVSWGDMPRIFESADAFLFTSIQDSFGSVLIEAMASGLPVLALDHQGPGTMVPDAASLKIPVTGPAGVRKALGSAIRRLSLDGERRGWMGKAAWEFARNEAWDLRAARMLDLYRELIRKHTLAGKNESGDAQERECRYVA